MKGRQEYSTGVGASSILMIFLVLCMTTLGILSYASARADLAISTRRQRHVEAYGAAIADAERVLAEIDAALYAAQQEPASYARQVQALAVEGVEITVADSLLISFALPFGNEQELQVAVQANGPDAKNRYDRVMFELVSVGEWIPDEDLLVFW